MKWGEYMRTIEGAACGSVAEDVDVSEFVGPQSFHDVFPGFELIEYEAVDECEPAAEDPIEDIEHRFVARTQQSFPVRW